EVVSVDPPSDDIDVEIIGGDSFVELTAQPGTDVVVVGYRGEPYLWFRPDGTVAENRNAPTTYQNLSRYGSDAPAGVDPEAAPDWHQVASGHRWAWHDHRAHWMQDTRPLGASPGDQILEAVVPLVVNDADVSVTVASTWQPAPSPVPAWLGAIAGGLSALGWWATRRRTRPAMAWLVPPAALALAVGGRQYLSLPSETDPRLVWWALPAVAVACSIAAIVAERQHIARHRFERGGIGSGGGFWADSAMLLVGVELAIWGWVKRDGLSAALIPTDAPGWLDRFAVAAAFTSGVGFAALALWALFGPVQRVQGGLGLAASGPPVSTS
ncbi:MAG: hypothetical protein ABWZ42_10750, partial [Ilumatobacteraceae bacterium]